MKATNNVITYDVMFAHRMLKKVATGAFYTPPSSTIERCPVVSIFRELDWSDKSGDDIIKDINDCFNDIFDTEDNRTWEDIFGFSRTVPIDVEISTFTIGDDDEHI